MYCRFLLALNLLRGNPAALSRGNSVGPDERPAGQGTAASRTQPRKWTLLEVKLSDDCVPGPQLQGDPESASCPVCLIYVTSFCYFRNRLGNETFLLNIMKLLDDWTRLLGNRGYWKARALSTIVFIILLTNSTDHGHCQLEILTITDKIIRLLNHAYLSHPAECLFKILVASLLCRWCI